MSSNDLAARPTHDPGPLDDKLRAVGYFPTHELATSLRLSVALDRPLLLEGPAGVGKTELARAAATALGRPFMRLQCYEGLDEAQRAVRVGLREADALHAAAARRGP